MWVIPSKQDPIVGSRLVHVNSYSPGGAYFTPKKSFDIVVYDPLVPLMTRTWRDLLLELKTLTYINAHIYQICSYHSQLTAWLVLRFICFLFHLRCFGPVLAGTMIHNSQHAFTYTSSQVAKGGTLQLGTPTKGTQTFFVDYWCVICLDWYEHIWAFWSITEILKWPPSTNEKSTYRLGLG